MLIAKLDNNSSKTFQKQPPDMLSVFKNFAKFTGKHLYPSLFFNKVLKFKVFENI